MSKRGNSPAFPLPQPAEMEAMPNEGMTLREYYAGLALQGLLANSEMVQVAMRTGKKENVDFQQVYASLAVEQADKLIARLEQDK